MSTSIETSQQHMINFLVQERVRNVANIRKLLEQRKAASDSNEREIAELLDLRKETEQEVTQVVEGLTRQTPQFVYFNEYGELARALVYSGEYPYQVCYEVLTPDGEHWKRRKAEHLIGREKKDITAQLTWLNRQFGMKHELLTQPQAVYSVKENDPERNSFLHVGMKDQVPLVGFEYAIGNPSLPPRAIGLLHGEDFKRYPKDCLIQLDRPPREMLEYAFTLSPIQ